jgi:hypothetical protein
MWGADEQGRRKAIGDGDEEEAFRVRRDVNTVGRRTKPIRTPEDFWRRR